MSARISLAAFVARSYRRTGTAVDITVIRSAEFLSRVTARLYWQRRLDRRRAKTALLVARRLRGCGIKWMLRRTRKLSEDEHYES